MSAIACKKKAVMRSRMARMGTDSRTWRTPTRMAPKKRSAGSALTLGSVRQRMLTKPQITDSTALSANT